MHGPACRSSQTPILPHLTSTHLNYIIHCIGIRSSSGQKYALEKQFQQFANNNKTKNHNSIKTTKFEIRKTKFKKLSKNKLMLAHDIINNNMNGVRKSSLLQTARGGSVTISEAASKRGQEFLSSTTTSSNNTSASSVLSNPSSDALNVSLNNNSSKKNNFSLNINNQNNE